MRSYFASGTICDDFLDIFIISSTQTVGQYLKSGNEIFHPYSFSFMIIPFDTVSLGSSVGIATRYRLDGPGMESRWGARFSAPVQTGPGPHPIPYTMSTESFTEVKRSEYGIDHPSTSSAEVTPFGA